MNQQVKAPSPHSAFEWQRSEKIASLNVTMEHYIHKATGAAHYHLASENDENVFLVGFRTVPTSSNGVAHILEHTALCGSEKYPVRDPFFMMIRRSLNTFMNAFTSSDWTAYPFASKNKKDFDNLLEVYLDAAFFSRLDPLDFAQEGHRLEFAQLDDPASELQYKGVVYNEMKGAMSSTNSVLWQTLSKHLFPTQTYHFNSGGEPEDIPDLSYEELLAFYKRHYHPSNAVFMTFGDRPAAEHQTRFEELALHRFERLDDLAEIADEKRYHAPIRVEEAFAAEPDEREQGHIVLGWLLGRSIDSHALFRAELLTAVLLDNSSSPLLAALETSELGSSPSPMCGLEDSNREMSFMAGLEGCKPSDTEAVERLVLSTLETIAAEGVDQEQVLAALHQLELSHREIAGDSYPYGLQLILGGLSSALHRGDPFELMDIDPVLEQLRAEVADPEFIPRLIREQLLNNQHRLTLTLRPDFELAKRKSEAERTKLDTIRGALSAQEEEQILSKSKALQARQSAEDDATLLPKVGIEDVPASLSEPHSKELTLSSGDLLNFYAQGTNGLAYQQVVFDLPALTTELIEILPLYTSCITELGVGTRDYAQTQAWQAQVCGGLNCFSTIKGQVGDIQTLQGTVSFSSKCLVNNHRQVSELIYETLTEVRFDETQRIAELVDQITTRKLSSITGSGHALAMSAASSGFSPSAKMHHQYGGLEGLVRLKALRDKLEDTAQRSKLLEKFRELHAILLSAPRQFLLVAEPEKEEELTAEIDSFWDKKAQTPEVTPFSLPSTRESVKQAWVTSTQVNFCAYAYPTVGSDHPDHATLQVLAGYLRNGFLHSAIREVGGAYGGGASQDPASASFRFFSYRDPRLGETLADFKASITWLLGDAQQESQLEEAVLGVIASMDKPSSPAGEAKTAFYNRLFGRTLEQRTEFRKRVLATTLEDLKHVATRYFVDQEPSLAVITSAAKAEELEIEGLEINKI
jgi:Zn-dependent M16 (insulinase) family peptidase